MTLGLAFSGGAGMTPPTLGVAFRGCCGGVGTAEVILCNVGMVGGAFAIDNDEGGGGGATGLFNAG